MAKEKKLTVADFFCGGGGFSEGFRQIGFDVKFALDNWQPAIDTHDLNHPECNAVLMNILELDTPEKIDATIDDTDIIIGSPPCVAFSGSNKAGKADKSLGIRLIEAYLRIVAWKKSKGIVKYWLLENVPNSGKYIKEKYTWKELGLPGKGPDLEIPVSGVFNAAEYGAPQGRKRFVCGDFPIPKKTHEENPIMMRQVFECLSAPSSRINKIKDPVYGFTIPASKLTDHFYDTRVAEFEWKRAKRLKEDHGFMGKMSFPENLDRPSRTVMATISASTRESMIFDSIDSDGKHDGFRLPTIREIATFMSFPITYQFQANGESSKYRLVGNAVCPKFSAALAKAIAKKENLNIPSKFINLPDNMPSVNLNGRKRKIKKLNMKKFDSKFAVHVPYLKKRSFRVELNNYASDFNNKEMIWSCILHHGSGQKAVKYPVEQHSLETAFQNVDGFKGFKKDVIETFSNKEVDALQLQEEYISMNDSVGPMTVLDNIRSLIDKHFPEKVFEEHEFDNTTRTIDINKDKIPLRILAANYACNHFVKSL